MRFADPTDADRYFTLEEVNEALGILDGVKEQFTVEEAMAGEELDVFGMHPPSVLTYANALAKAELGKHPQESTVALMSTMWMDGLILGLCLAASVRRDDR